MSNVRTLDTSNTRQLIDEFSYVLMAHGTAIFPTDTVYGIGCLATANNPAHKRIFELKERPAHQPLPWLIADFDDVLTYAEKPSESALALATELWPGALTLIVKASAEVPHEYCGANGTVALRIPDFDVVRTLARECQAPLATTSANPHGAPEAHCVAELDRTLMDSVDLVVDAGHTRHAHASTIIDASGPDIRIIRHGALSDERINEIVR
ncbi:MAG: threonylcarbamoyl-AMP synthase [Atopobiaceae bacterium]|nr:threonylcarbamoyl-AMP synthase [Atopobiaceae bacterium]